jgi:hypothetical protein
LGFNPRKEVLASLCVTGMSVFIGKAYFQKSNEGTLSTKIE